MNDIDTIEIAIFNFSLIIILLIVVIAFIIVVIMFMVKDKIHHSYHKGYSEGNNDNLKYYKAMKEIEKSYNELTNSLGNQTFNKETYEYISKLKGIIKEYREVN